jgi:hypothetical protein
MMLLPIIAPVFTIVMFFVVRILDLIHTIYCYIEKKISGPNVR